MFSIHCNIVLETAYFITIFYRNLTFNGYTKLENCAEPSHKSASEYENISHEGGTITSFQSIVIFTGVSNLLNNQARHGGAILAIDSTIIIYGKVKVVNNLATDSSGDGISLQHSNLDVKGNCYITNNHAMMGGGIHATSSTITTYVSGTLQIINNSADNGGGT